MIRVLVVDDLSAREIAVLRLLARGASNKEIAAQLDLSENTITSHLSHIFEKLGVKSRTEAAMVALQRGLIPPQ
ncbi:MAG: response regulator transcription factor [Chloroflexales bacterium]|nr:response regulator transcription factor [Chloroflexales bacterium]